MMEKLALIPFMLSMAFAGQSQAALTDGVYETTVNGHNAPMTVKVTIKDHKIAAIDTSKNLESFGVGKVALDKTAAAILKDQTTGVDNITGASLSSLALKSAVRTCLQKAGASDQDLKNYTRKVSHISSTPGEYKADVAIIGGGGTGLAAAVSALENGAKKVVILEKLGYLGGSTNVSGGALNAVDDKRQKAQGIEDSVQKFYETQ